MRPYVAPLPSPKPPKPVETITGVHRAVKQTRKWAAIIGMLTAIGGGGAIHQLGRQHTDEKVDERTAVLETQQRELDRRMGELEHQVDGLDQHQVDAEKAAQQRQAELLEAIGGRKHR